MERLFVVLTHPLLMCSVLLRSISAKNLVLAVDNGARSDKMTHTGLSSVRHRYVIGKGNRTNASMMVLHPFETCNANGDEEDKGCQDLEATVWMIVACLTGKKHPEEDRSSTDSHKYSY